MGFPWKRNRKADTVYTSGWTNGVRSMDGSIRNLFFFDQSNGFFKEKAINRRTRCWKFSSKSRKITSGPTADDGNTAPTSVFKTKSAQFQLKTKNAAFTQTYGRNNPVAARAQDFTTRPIVIRRQYIKLLIAPSNRASAISGSVQPGRHYS